MLLLPSLAGSLPRGVSRGACGEGGWEPEAALDWCPGVRALRGGGWQGLPAPVG